MYVADFKCQDCEAIEEVFKEKMIDDFIYKKCSKCGSYRVNRIYSAPLIDTAEGSVGNASTGYSKSVVNKHSKFGQYKGTKVDTNC